MTMESNIECITAAATPQAAFDNFCSIVRTYGYDKIAYSLVNDHPSLGLPRQHGFATSYPEDWMRYYKARNYMSFDPVTARVLSCRKPFFWSDVTAPLKKNDKSFILMNEAADAGLAEGIAISLPGYGDELVGIGLARASSKENKKDLQAFADLHLLSVFFHETFRGLVYKPALPVLSKREVEILSWGAEGKTDDDISSILGISFATVRFHWQNIFTKLHAHSRIYAITKATHLRLIVPASIACNIRPDPAAA